MSQLSIDRWKKLLLLKTEDEGGPLWFARRYMTDFQSPPHVRDFADASWLMLNCKTVNRQVIEAPVRHGKSVWHSIIIPAYLNCLFSDWMVLGASYGSDLAGEFARKVKILVDRAAGDFGLKFDTSHNRSTSWRFSNYPGGYDSTSAGGPISGKGYHFLAFDDLVKDDEAARSPTQRANLASWFYADALTRVEPGGKVSLVMSRRHPSDLSGSCLDKNAELDPEQKWQHITFKAIDDDGRALWPERYPIERLRAIQRDFELDGKSYQFDALFQQNPRANPELCEWPDDYFGSWMFFDEYPPGLHPRLTILACDPSKGARSKSGDYCGVAKITLDSNNFLWVDPWLRRLPTMEVVDNVAAEITAWQPDAAICETDEDQSALMLLIQERLDKAQCPTPLYPYWPVEDKNVRIRMALDEWLRLKRIRIRDSVSGRLVVKQLQEFPSGEHDDGPDAIAMGLALAGQLRRGRA